MAEEPEFVHRNRGVCSSYVAFNLDDDNKIHDVQFAGGCNGNLAAIGKLAEGMPAEWVIERLAGNTCGPRPTSCADQFAQALQEALGQRQAVAQ